MSTILKALRKLEAQDSARPVPPAPPWKRQRTVRRATARWLPLAVAGIALAAMVTALAVYGWRRGASNPPPEFIASGAGRGNPAPPAASPPVPPGTQPAAVPRETGLAAAPRTTAAETSQTPDEATGKPLRSTARDDGDRLRTAAPGRLQPASDRDSRPARPVLTVQAIAWSSEPAARIAVIDGHVLHEGERIGSVEVTRIDKDQVVLTESGRSWKVGFGG